MVAQHAMKKGYDGRNRQFGEASRNILISRKEAFETMY